MSNEPEYVKVKHYETYPGMSNREWLLIKAFTADMAELNCDTLRKGYEDCCMTKEEWKGSVEDHNKVIDVLARFEVPEISDYYILVRNV